MLRPGQIHVSPYKGVCMPLARSVLSAEILEFKYAFSTDKGNVVLEREKYYAYHTWNKFKGLRLLLNARI